MERWRLLSTRTPADLPHAAQRTGFATTTVTDRPCLGRSPSPATPRYLVGSQTGTTDDRDRNLE